MVGRPAGDSAGLCVFLIATRLQSLWIWREQPVLHFPLLHKLTDSSPVSFVAHGRARLGPFEKGFEVDFVAALHHNVADISS